ncbi:MAG: GMC oxidoreductase [Roseiarcus sp.]
MQVQGDAKLIFEYKEAIGGSVSTHAEILIVGGGTVGLTLAVHLARAGRDLLVLEAGPESLRKESQQIFEAARNIGVKLEGLHLGRFRTLGGTSNFWGGQLVRFDPLVFAPRPWVSDRAAWPISYDDVAPYYEQVFALVGMTNVENDDAAVARRLRIDAPPLPPELEFIFTRWTPEANFATLFEKDIRARPNLRVVTNAQVVALTLAEDGRRVSGVETADIGARRTRYTAPQVVLANGTIEIARLLSLPLADGALPPWHANAWIGKGFMDHIDCIAGEVHLDDRKRFHHLFDNALLDGIKYQPKLKLSQAAQRQQRLLGIAAHFIFKSSVSDNLANAKIFFKAMLRGRLEGGLSAAPRQIYSLVSIGAPMVVRYLRYNRIHSPADLGVQLRLTSEQRQVAESGIRLRPERDAFGMPLVDMDWKIDGAEIETLATFAELIADYLRGSGLATVRLDEMLAARDPAFMASIDDANHHIGMARMAGSAADGVVDSDLRVHGIENLYVAGSAVYPSSGFANPTFTALALGLRLADKLLEGRDR